MLKNLIFFAILSWTYALTVVRVPSLSDINSKPVCVVISATTETPYELLNNNIQAVNLYIALDGGMILFLPADAYQEKFTRLSKIKPIRKDDKINFTDTRYDPKISQIVPIGTELVYKKFSLTYKDEDYADIANCLINNHIPTSLCGATVAWNSEEVFDEMALEFKDLTDAEILDDIQFYTKFRNLSINIMLQRKAAVSEDSLIASNGFTTENLYNEEQLKVTSELLDILQHKKSLQLLGYLEVDLIGNCFAPYSAFWRQCKDIYPYVWTYDGPNRAKKLLGGSSTKNKSIFRRIVSKLNDYRKTNEREDIKTTNDIKENLLDIGYTSLINPKTNEDYLQENVWICRALNAFITRYLPDIGFRLPYNGDEGDIFQKLKKEPRILEYMKHLMDNWLDDLTNM